MHRSGFEPEQPTWQAGVLPSYTIGAYFFYKYYTD